MSSDSWGLDGKTMLITGGASGIGQATARPAAADGADVVIADLPRSAGAGIASEIGGSFVAFGFSDLFENRHCRWI